MVGKPEGKSPLGRPRRRWEDNIKGYSVSVGKHERDHLEDPGVDWRIILRDAGFWGGNTRERDQLEDPSVDGRIILRDTGFWWGNMRERDH